jgi:hypothetical protein
MSQHRDGLGRILIHHRHDLWITVFAVMLVVGIGAVSWSASSS